MRRHRREAELRQRVENAERVLLALGYGIGYDVEHAVAFAAGLRQERDEAFEAFRRDVPGCPDGYTLAQCVTVAVSQRDNWRDDRDGLRAQLAEAQERVEILQSRDAEQSALVVRAVAAEARLADLERNEKALRERSEQDNELVVRLGVAVEKAEANLAQIAYTLGLPSGTSGEAINEAAWRLDQRLAATREALEGLLIESERKMESGSASHNVTWGPYFAARDAARAALVSDRDTNEGETCDCGARSDERGVQHERACSMYLDEDHALGCPTRYGKLSAECSCYHLPPSSPTREDNA